MHLPGHNFTGPGTQLLWGKHRLNNDLSYKDRSKPINRVDEAGYHHDVCYLKNKDTKTRNEVCDTNMLKELDAIEKPSIRERIERVKMHNLTGYDSHLFIKELGFDTSKIDAIPNTEEKYISFSKRIGGMKLRFIDSLKFMSSSLDHFLKNLRKMPENELSKYPPKIRQMKYINYLKSKFRETSFHFPDDKLDLITRKGVYPYDYMDSKDKYEETKLPPKDKFYNRLNECHITDEEYQHAQRVWKAFNIKNLGEYTDLYIKTDVLILTDVFENFRDVCLKTYKLDPDWYFTAPGLSWDAMLKMTNVKLDLLDDYDMILMLEKGLRGGVSQCCNRYGKANNKYMKNYDKSKESNYLMYLDANNLYGWAISQYLPYGEFEWCDDKITRKLSTLKDDSETGYIFEISLKYLKELHDYHSGLPLCPENRIPENSKQGKLLTTLYDKEKYVVHYRSLKQYLKMGLEVVKVHRILKFKQSNWLKKYIDLNTEMRKKATNDFEKDFYKLMNNSVFVKTMENIRKRIDVRLCCNYDQVKKLIAKPNFKSRTIFDENLVAVHMKKTKILFNKPIYVGMSILDLSKYLMYDFHYNVMKPRYKNNIKLLYMDTDSFIYDIKTDDFYEDMKSMIDYFDTSDYQENNPYNMPRCNKKVLGKMKDENSGVIMEEFVGLRSKMYAKKLEEQSVEEYNNNEEDKEKHIKIETKKIKRS
ncbi:hypothetical protein AVEN_140029-1 [Araneus ventricosus]|uniref:Phospholipase A2-like domain-containing protein n=1 Tax=Araneus ventricosus TaxID=182803 RepID=A0A4Y2PBN5_ARAVE|nr:hypothetical protein AVEN_140029-1 [Araneus ventricosus]